MGNPTGKDLSTELDVALEAARAAAAITLEGWGRPLDIEHKGAVELVTEYDRRAEEAARARIAGRFPKDALVLEESGTANLGGNRVWYVDPLDGTTNFSHGLPLFGTSVGLTVDDVLSVGVVVVPALSWEFAASKGGGATFNGKPMRVSSVSDMNDALAVTGFPYFRRERTEILARSVTTFIKAAQGVRRLGAAALDLCFVACGWLDVFFEMGLHSWDVAAGMLLVQEAGGRVTEWNGGRPEEVLNTGNVAASNGRLHPRLLELLSEILEAESK